MQSRERSLDAALSILLRGATLHGRNLSLYRSSSVAGRPCNTVYNRFSILSPHSPPPPFFISPSWHWETRVAAGSNRRNDSGLRRGGKKEKKNKARNRGRFELGRNYLFFFFHPFLSSSMIRKHDALSPSFFQTRFFFFLLSLPLFL